MTKAGNGEKQPQILRLATLAQDDKGTGISRFAFWVNEWLWVPILIFIFWAFFDLAKSSVGAWVEWYRAGGMQ